MEMELAKKTIADSARSCLKSFEACLEQSMALTPLEQSQIEDQIGRFSIWTSNIGVFAPGRASMDYRLAEAEDIREIVIGLLQVLENRSQALINEVTTLKNPRSDPSCKSIVQSSVEAISGDISLLHQLSNNIHKAGRESRNAKADDFFKEKDEEKNDLEQFQKYFASDLVQRKFPNCDVSIQARLASAMRLRRQRILYYKERYGKTPLENTKQAYEPKAKLKIGQPQPNLPAVTNETPTAPIEPAEGTKRSVIASQAPTATTLDADRFKKIANPSVVSGRKTIALENHEQLPFPPSPNTHIIKRYNEMKARRMEKLTMALYHVITAHSAIDYLSQQVLKSTEWTHGYHQQRHMDSSFTGTIHQTDPTAMDSHSSSGDTISQLNADIQTKSLDHSSKTSITSNKLDDSNNQVASQWELAESIASAILQMHKISWLREKWDRENILAINRGIGRIRKGSFIPLDLRTTGELKKEVNRLVMASHRDHEADWKLCQESTPETVCPYCCCMLSKSETGDERKWREHLMGDLDAYVCLFPNCDEADQLYSHSREWLQHMRRHTLTWLCMARSHKKVLSFGSQDEYERHMREYHKGKFSESQLPLLGKRSTRSLGPLFTDCPLCTIDNSSLHGSVEDHVVGHLRFLALKSLPFIDEEAAETLDEESMSSDSFGMNKRSTIDDESAQGGKPVFDDPDSYYHLATPDDPIKSIDEHTVDVQLINEERRQAEWGFVLSGLPDDLEPYPIVHRRTAFYPHKAYENAGEVPFRYIRFLGAGRIGAVEEVEGSKYPFEGHIYARKSILLSREPSLREKEIEEIQDFITVAKQLNHKHIIHVVNTYNFRSFFDIIMEPCADENLEFYLDTANSQSEEAGTEARKLIAEWFRCLLNAINYVHQRGSSHLNIKLTNVLVKDGVVLFTDFRSGFPTAFRLSPGLETRDYCAPEVESRRFVSEQSADIFSLGAIFLEMLTVHAMPGRLEDLRKAIRYEGRISYARNLTKVFEWMDTIQASSDQASWYKKVLTMCRWMMDEESTKRPSAGYLCAWLCDEMPSEMLSDCACS